MENKEAIDFLNNLEVGMFCTVNIPLCNEEKMPITAMYMGKDNEGKYNFLDTGRFVMSKQFIEKQAISIDKEFDGDKAMDIYAKFRMKQERKMKKDNRER